jgi:hypothetical protein
MQQVRHHNSLVAGVVKPIFGGDRSGHNDMEKTIMPLRKIPRNIVLWAPVIAIALVLAIWALGAIDFLASQ